ncbi:BspA family leucine-rich repeat surface protein [Companilactobacillus keshanensis]|uniref:BspA family leucine-rich repeat surface protein n=1 Tax=Companilactobacillus keshanensis TaxID=2486003 RepID=A0ABW4BUR8_9LACO|nr:BspA family leucine-rich repeat surface protein [Companilactobacillus keshanensis]
MRFQQLKCNQNIILRKRLYKSGKNWMIKSSLSFAGGLILFGATQVLTVSADTVPSVQTTQDVDSSGSNQSNTAQSNTNTIGNSSNNKYSTNSEQKNTVTVNNQSNNNLTNNNMNDSESQRTVQYSAQPSEPVAQANAQDPTQRNQVQQTSNATATTTDPSTIPTGAQKLGSCYYYVDDNEVMHFTAGEFTQAQYDAIPKDDNGPVFKGINYKPYNKVSFDGKVIAHGSIAKFFQFTQITSIDNLDNFDTSDVTDFSDFLNSSKIQSFDLGKIDTSKATSMSNMFASCSDLTSINTRKSDGTIFDTSKVTNFSGMFANDNSLKSLDISGLDTQNAVDLERMFMGDANIKYLDVSSFDTSKDTNMDSMFEWLGQAVDGIVNINGLEKFNTSNVTDMSFMFAGVNFNAAELKGFNTSKVKSMNSMFWKSTLQGKLDLSNFTGDSLVSMSEMFLDAKGLTEIDLSNLNTPNLIDSQGLDEELSLWGAFEGCENLVKVDLSKFNSKNVNNYMNLFKDCSKLTTIIWPNESTDSATKFNSMFSNDSSLTSDSLEFLNQFNASKVTDFSSMFYGCSAITNLHSIESWNVNSASNLAQMFDEDKSLTDLDLSSWNLNNANDFSWLFDACISLSSLKLPEFDDPKDSNNFNMSNMFTGDDKLNLLDFSKFNVPIGTDKENMLTGVKHLYKLILNNKVNLDDSNLSYYDIYKGWYNVGNGTDEDPEGNLILHDGNEMMKTYSNDNGPDETWVIAERKFVNYQVKYVDYDTGKVLDKSYNISDETREGWPLTIQTLKERNISVPGYDMDTYYYGPDDTAYSYDNGEDLTVIIPMYGTDAANNLIYTVKVKASNLIIKVSDIVNPIILPVGDPNPVSANKNFESLNSTKQLNPDKTKIDLNMGVNNGDVNSSETTLFKMIYGKDFSGPFPATVKDLVTQILSAANVLRNGIVIRACSLTIDPVYITNPDPNNGNNSGGTTNDRVVTAINQTSATFADRPAVQLYDFDGKAIEGRMLGINTDWKNDQKMTLDGQTYYRVSTDEWVKDNDVYIYVGYLAKVRTYKENKVQLKNAHLDDARVLDPSTDWKTDRYAILNGQNYYRVSTNEFVPFDKVYEYQDSDKVIHSKRATPIYDERGNDVLNTLIPNSDYKTDKSVNINKETYYRVSTDEFVKKSDII